MPTFQASETEFIHQCDSCGRDATFLDLIRHHAIWVCCVCYRERTACPAVVDEVARERKVYDGGPRIEF
jgi:heterodisulfide reductase subunit C